MTALYISAEERYSKPGKAPSNNTAVVQRMQQEAAQAAEIRQRNQRAAEQRQQEMNPVAQGSYMRQARPVTEQLIKEMNLTMAEASQGISRDIYQRAIANGYANSSEASQALDTLRRLGAANGR